MSGSASGYVCQTHIWCLFNSVCALAPPRLFYIVLFSFVLLCIVHILTHGTVYATGYRMTIRPSSIVVTSGAAKLLPGRKPTLPTSRQNAIKTCRPSSKHPQLRTQSRKTEFLNSICALQIQIQGAGKYPQFSKLSGPSLLTPTNKMLLLTTPLYMSVGTLPHNLVRGTHNTRRLPPARNTIHTGKLNVSTSFPLPYSSEDWKPLSNPPAHPCRPSNAPKPLLRPIRQRPPFNPPSATLPYEHLSYYSSATTIPYPPTLCSPPPPTTRGTHPYGYPTKLYPRPLSEELLYFQRLHFFVRSLPISTQARRPPAHNPPNLKASPLPVQVLLCTDIYQFHLPVVTLGGLYNHLPLDKCTSPSTAMLLSGHVPIEALYLLTIPDCAAASAIILTNPFAPDTPKPNTYVLEAPKRKGRPPVHRPIKTKANSPPTSLATPVGRPPKTSQPSSVTSASSNSSDTSILECLCTLSAHVQVLNVRLNAIESHRPPLSKNPVQLEDKFCAIGNSLPILHTRILADIFLQALLHLLATKPPITWMWNNLLLNAVLRMTLPRAPVNLLKATIAFTFDFSILMHYATCVISATRNLLITLINFLYTNSSVIRPIPSLRFKTNKCKHFHLDTQPLLYTPKLIAATTIIPHKITCLNLRQVLHNTTHNNLTKRVILQSNPIERNNATMFSIKFNTNSAFYEYHNNKALTLHHLIHVYTVMHHPLPHTCRLSYNNKTIPLNTPLHLFAHQQFPTFHILLPILGGMNIARSPSSHVQTHQSASTPQNSSPINPSPRTNATNQHSRTLTQQTINRKHFTIRVATLNCNGAPKKANTNENNLIWQFVNQSKIDVLFLIDHRSSNRTLEYLRQSGERYLNKDIRLINSEITLLHSLNNRQGPDTSYHATVGGCAILTFGSLAHITFPTNFTDPSGGNTFIGAKLQYDTSYPPIFLNAIYLFPPSPGPTTLATRISKYLTSIHNKQSPCLWQREVIQNLLQNQHDEHPHCVQIVGGDFNHQNWSCPTHPVTDIFLTKLKFTNFAYNMIQQQHPDISPIITFNSSQKWLDHILLTGHAHVTQFTTYPTSILCTYTDHIPYSNDIRINIPTAHYNIPHNLHYSAKTAMRATHIKRHDTFTIKRFENLCNQNKHKLIPPNNTWSLHDYSTYYENTCTLLVNLAKKATKYTIPTSQPSFSAWSPAISFLYKYMRFLLQLKQKYKNAQLSSPSSTNHPAYTKILQFLCKAYFATKTMNNMTHLRYREIINQVHPNYPTTLPAPILTTLDLTTFITQTLLKCKHLTHAKHQKELRAKINKITKKHENNRQTGKIRQVVQWILEKDSPRRFTTAVTTSNIIHSHPKEAHEATLAHFTNHVTAHPWIQLSKLNDPSPAGEALRNSLLNGTWRTDYPTIIHTLPPRYHHYAAAYLDNFRYKASVEQKLDLSILIDKPITFETFHSALMQKSGTKSPGPTGLTISILQNTPTPVLQSIYTALNVMWTQHHVPPSWKRREMALLPKKPNSVTLAELRPLMLLEVLRKLWLGLFLKPIAAYLVQNNLLCSYQSGGIPNSGTEDTILQIINTIEDSSERAQNLEILAFDKAKAFDSPGRIGGISLAWQRLGVPKHIANYIADCDNNNQIFPRTPYYLTNNKTSDDLAFHASMGTPQGCSSASISYVVVEDIILSTFQTQLTTIDPYYARDPSGILFPQPPTQFVDDTYVFCSSTSGAQNAIDLLQTAEPLLNIRINPSKTRHFSLQWCPPTSNSKPYYTLKNPSQTLYAYDTNAVRTPISPIPLSSPTRALGAMITPDNSSTHIADIKLQINRIKHIMLKKKASIQTIWAILKQCVYPKFTYILKFSNISMYDLNNLSGSLRDLLRTKSNASHLPNAILFADSKCSYGHTYYDLMTHTLREKESTMLRMLAGAPYSRQIMHCLLSRGQRLISDNQSFSHEPIPCPQLPNYMRPTEQTQYSWALSLIQYLQIAQSNIHTTQLFPQHNTTKICTQTPIHTYYNANDDAPLTLNDIRDFETSYHLYFIEELFPYPPTDPTSFLPNLLQLFPTQYHRYISKATNTAFLSPHLSLGQVIYSGNTQLFAYQTHRQPHTLKVYITQPNQIVSQSGHNFGNFPISYDIVHPDNP